MHVIPDATLEAGIAVIGKKGRGKTYVAKALVERLLDLGRRVVVLDPLSAWWGLKARSDGREGYPVVVFGGPHADIALDDEMGRALGRWLAAGDMSAVIDLGLMRKAEQCLSTVGASACSVETGRREDQRCERTCEPMDW